MEKLARRDPPVLAFFNLMDNLERKELVTNLHSC